MGWKWKHFFIINSRDTGMIFEKKINLGGEGTTSVVTK